MPFTGAHPLAILPLLRARFLDPTCLVIGSMAPDLEYLARGGIGGKKFGHSFPGVFGWCIPITILVALLVDHARGCLRPWSNRWPLQGPLILGVSAFIGACSHLVFDAFTHVDGFICKAFPALIPYAPALHRGFSIAGTAIVAIVLVVHTGLLRRPDNRAR